MKPAFRNLFVNILLSFASVLALCIALELILRPTHLFGARISWATPDPLIGYHYVPHAPYWHFKENDHPVTGVINRWGWRDREWTLEKPPGIRRIALLGDSYVEAIDVEQDSTFAALAERSLAAGSPPRVELMNFGAAGFTQSEELLVLTREVVRFHPDMVILFFWPWDIPDIRRETAPNKDRPFFIEQASGVLSLDTSFNHAWRFRIRRSLDFIKRRSALISLLSERYNAYHDAPPEENPADQLRQAGPHGRSLGPMSLCTSHADPVYMQNYGLNKRLIGEMVSFCRTHAMQFMLVCMDIDAYCAPVEQLYRDVDSSFNQNYFEDDLARFSDSLQIPYLGLQRIFHEYYSRSQRSLHWGHWNYEGHRIVADALAARLRTAPLDWRRASDTAAR
jgi:hypothetical protein